MGDIPGQDETRRRAGAIEVVIPNTVEMLTSDHIQGVNPDVLIIAESVNSVEEGVFAHTSLSKIYVEPGNESLCTDGSSLYTAGFDTLLCCGVNASTYEIDSRCKSIAPHAFTGRDIAEVVLPQGLATIDEYAFTASAIKHIVIPGTVATIGAHAFEKCSRLAEVTLEDGVGSIGAEAFKSTALATLTLPASISSIGLNAFASTKLAYDGANATFTIDAANPHFSIDETGCLYAREDGKVVAVEMLNEAVEEYRLDPATIAVGTSAFQKARNLKCVEFPEGLARIEEAAFKDCRSLKQANFPASLQCVGAEAFMGTALSEIAIPAALTNIGPCALVTCSTVPGGIGTKTKSITVEAGNPTYSIEGSLLLEKLDDGTFCVVTHFGKTNELVLGRHITRVAPYALNGAPDIRQLVLTDSLVEIGTCGLAIHGPIESIELQLTEPIEGHDAVRFTYPDSETGQYEILSLLKRGTIEAGLIVEGYDTTLSSLVDDVNRSQRILERLTDPYLMTAKTKSRFDRLIRVRFKVICKGFTDDNNQAGFEMLADMGYINADNINDVVDEVSLANNVALTGFLMELKRRRFNNFMDDFEL